MNLQSEDLSQSNNRERPISWNNSRAKRGEGAKRREGWWH